MYLIVPDTHFKEHLGYADHVADRRIKEREEILDFVVSQAEDCSAVIFVGDIFNSRSNPSSVIKECTNFIERFSGKEVFILAGNHDKSGGKSAIDYLAEIKNPKWHVIINEVYTWNNVTFCPYFTKAELGVSDYGEATSTLMKKFKKNDIFVCHHSISGTFMSEGMSTDSFNEIVLPREELEKKYNLVIGGHIHTPSQKGRVIVTGSLFNNEVGEQGKFVWKVNEETMEEEQIAVPGRPIYKFINPSLSELDLPVNSIVKVIITDKEKTKDIEGIREKLETYDAGLILEQYSHERRRLNLENEVVDFENIDSLLSIYASERKVDLGKLQLAFQLIK